MRRSLIVLLLLPLLLVACETGKNLPRADVVSFDRGTFSLFYADFTAPTRIKCEKDKLEKKDVTPACASYEIIDATVRQAIIDAPKKAAAEAAAAGANFDLSSLGPLLLKLAPLAAAAGS